MISYDVLQLMKVICCFSVNIWCQIAGMVAGELDTLDISLNHQIIPVLLERTRIRIGPAHPAERCDRRQKLPPIHVRIFRKYTGGFKIKPTLAPGGCFFL